MYSSSSPKHRLTRSARLIAGSAVIAAILTGGAFTGVSQASSGHRHLGTHHSVKPLMVTVFSPGSGDVSGKAGAGFIVDLAVDATDAAGNALLSSTNGYQPFFNDPTSSTFHPGVDPGAPGLVVLLSTTPKTPGTPLQGPDTNLAGLFQLNGVANVGGKAETWNTWQVGKALFGTGQSRLTVYVVPGTAPTVVSAETKPISNVVTVPFTIAP